jgi:predicted CXXCH cytochrome family protein
LSRTLHPLARHRAGAPSARARWATAALAVLAAAPAFAANSILFSRHNLSMTGPGTVRAVNEPEICIFCHGAHGTAPQAPLWNRSSSGVVYIPYSSSTLNARVGQPTGSSALCLSCHDGTVAMGKVRNRKKEIPMRGTGSRAATSRANLGTNLSDDHPVSFAYDRSLANRSDGELRDPAVLPPEVRLDHQQQMQCTTCHDAHHDTYGKFLVMDNREAALCVACHDPRGWAQSVHRTSTATWNGSGADPWPSIPARTVAEAGCESCHTPHNAGTPQRLLLQANEEDTCLSCHNGHVAADNLDVEFTKLSRHDIAATTGVHDPTEDPVNGRRHVECTDCHNAHAAHAADATPPKASGALAGVAGITAAGAAVNPVLQEYELCFRCHADSRQKGPATVSRLQPETNTRLEFSTANASFHPVVGAGRNPDVPSLLSPWRTSSVIYCTDCHNNNQGPGAGGKGPNGPHGSAFAPILERRLEFADFRAESAASYALCYKCHGRESVLANQSFSLHNLHVVEAQTACTTCHDSHGVPDASHLINFNRAYVSPNDKGRLDWTDGGRLRGMCNLSCHGENHENAAYDKTGARHLPDNVDLERLRQRRQAR